MQVAWRSCATRLEAAELEGRLLGRYAKEHMELPPLNQQRPLRLLQQCVESISELQPTLSYDQLECGVRTAIRQLEQRAAKPNAPGATIE